MDANLDQIKRALENCPWKNHLEILAPIKLSFYLLKLSKIFSQITFPMKQLLVITEIHLELTTRLGS